MMPTEAEAEFWCSLARAYHAPSAEIMAAQGIEDLEVELTAKDVAKMQAASAAMRALIEAWRADFKAEMDEVRRG